MIIQLGDEFQEWYLKTYGQIPTPELLTHLRRDLFQLIWMLILNPEFIEAYSHGFEWTCVDGTRRLLFPRILTYSADYPEKYALTSSSFKPKCRC